jgi:uncharacterized protein
MVQKSPAQDPASDLPARIPLFPLREAILFPGEELPLNIFEPRYRAMTQWAMGTDRLIGMIQPQNTQGDLYHIGCVGKITHYQETKDGRYLITLQGVSRFTLTSKPHLTTDNYFMAHVDWSGFTQDRTPQSYQPPAHMCRKELRSLLTRFLEREHLSIDWDQAACIPDLRFYTLLAMVAPFSVAEKQALLEAPTLAARCEMLIKILDMTMADEKHLSADKHFH